MPVAVGSGLTHLQACSSAEEEEAVDPLPTAASPRLQQLAGHIVAREPAVVHFILAQLALP